MQVQMAWNQADAPFLLKSFPKTPHSQFLKKFQLPFNLIFSEKIIQCSRTFAMQVQTAWNEADASLKQLDNKALWASAEVIKTSANIKKTAQVRNDVASILDKHGVDIWIKALMRLQGHDTSAWCGTFTVKCLCKIWEVPKTMETTIWQKLASWELDETGESRLDGTMSMCQLQEGPTSLTLNDGKYLQFSTRVAGVILYCKAFHLTGWSNIDYSQEFDSFYAAYKHWFEEFSKRFNFGISSKLLHFLFPSFDTAAGTLK